MTVFTVNNRNNCLTKVTQHDEELGGCFSISICI